METISYKLEQFEGPLDLMLHLIAQHKLDIFEIEITVVMEQYLEAIREMQQTDMEIASSFLEMASRLVYIKTLSLLPKRQEEQEQLTRELTGQLIEYSLCKEIAGILGGDYVGDRLFAHPPEKVEADMTYRGIHRLEELMRAYLVAVGRGQRRLPPSEEVFRPIVRRHVVSVSSRIAYLLQRLYDRSEIPFEQLFAGISDRSELVATFLAVLELIKDKRIQVQDDDALTITALGSAPLPEMNDTTGETE